jgi:hypothetical protein
MATRIRFRRGSTADHATFTGAEGELTVNTSKDTLVVHDGTTVGGFELMRSDLNNLGAGTAIPAVNITAVDCGTYT